MTGAVAGGVLGLVVAAGVLLVLSWGVARRPLSLADRLQLNFSGLQSGPHAVRRDAIGRMIVRARLSDRLDRAGLAETPRNYRFQQLAFAGLGACCGAVLGIVVGADALPAALVLPAVGGVAGAALCDWRLAGTARRRRERIEAQLPAAAELLAFAVAAGEGTHGALIRVGKCMDGDLAREFETVTNDVRAGMSMEASLRAMSRRVDSVRVDRLVDSLVLAMERGTPLAEILRAQAAAAQADHRRHLMEVAGRKDVAMLVPVVFLILPTVVAIALFPGLASLRLLTS